MNTELETKIEVSRDSLDRLRSACRILREHEQLNVYYDSNDELSRRAATLRVRYEKDSSPRFTLKLPIGTNSGRRCSLEVEAPSRRMIPARKIHLEDFAPSFQGYLSEMGVSGVVRLGAMRTFRVDAVLPSGLPVELDMVRLPGGSTFCEVEIESDDVAVHTEALAEIRSIIGSFSFSHRSKFERFVGALRERLNRQDESAHSHPPAEYT